MTHGFDSEIARAADDTLAPEARLTLDAHLASCDACRALFDAQREARAILVARPIVPVRDLSARIRAALDAERPWIERLNWRIWSLRVAPVAAALAIVAVLLVRTADSSAATDTAVATTATAESSASVASALWSEDVSEDTLLHLLLRANPDDALSNYVGEK